MVYLHTSFQFIKISLPKIYLTFQFVQNYLPATDLIFGVSFLAYINLANTICFQSNKLALSQKKGMKPDSLGRGIFLGKPSFSIYMRMFFVFTFLLPIVSCIYYFSRDERIMRPIISPTILLLLQIFGEATTTSHHDICRILVPIGFNAYRLISLMNWTKEAIAMYVSSSSTTSSLGYELALALAIINTVMWFYNLFGFLLLRVLPVYFDKDETPPVEMAYLLIPYPAKKVVSNLNQSEIKK
jgi:hypothetical protein